MQLTERCSATVIPNSICAFLQSAAEECSVSKSAADYPATQSGRLPILSLPIPTQSRPVIAASILPSRVLTAKNTIEQFGSTNITKIALQKYQQKRKITHCMTGAN